jgi:hypothetical protein
MIVVRYWTILWEEVRQRLRFVGRHDVAAADPGKWQWSLARDLDAMDRDVAALA